MGRSSLGDGRRGVTVVVVAVGVLVGVGAGAALTEHARNEAGKLVDHQPGEVVRSPRTTGSGLAFEHGQPTTTVPMSAPGQLQLTPGVRDIRVRVDGVVLASDDRGRIPLPAGNGDPTVEVLGYEATPAIQQVDFLGWSDGSSRTSRTVSRTGPSPLIDIEVKYRVEVAVPGSSPEDTVRFDSSVGTVELHPGVPTWIPALRPDHRGLIGYRVAKGTRVSDLTHADLQQFLPTPEALWTVDRPIG